MVCVVLYHSYSQTNGVVTGIQVSEWQDLHSRRRLPTFAELSECPRRGMILPKWVWQERSDFQDSGYQ